MTAPLPPLAEGFALGEWQDQGAAPYPCRLSSYWNGWASPWVTLETFKRLAADLDVVPGVDALLMGPDDTPMVSYADGGAVDALSSVEVDGVQYYDVSLGWCWTDVDEGGNPPARDTPALIERFERLRDDLAGQDPPLRMVGGLRRPSPNGGFVFPVNVAADHSYVGSIEIRADGSYQEFPSDAARPLTASP